MGTRKSKHNKGRKPEYKDHGNAEVVEVKRVIGAEELPAELPILYSEIVNALPEICAPVSRGIVTTDKVLLVKPKQAIEAIPPEWEIDSTQPEGEASANLRGKYSARHKQRGAFAAGMDISFLAKQIPKLVPTKFPRATKVKTSYRKPENAKLNPDHCMGCDAPIEVEGRSYCNACNKRDKTLEKMAQYAFRYYFENQVRCETFENDLINEISDKELDCKLPIAAWRENQVEW